MIYHIYVFMDNKNRPYYVGKTNNMVRRENEHKKAIIKGDPLPKYNKARKLIKKGIPLKMITIRTTKTEKRAYKLERYFIFKFRSDGYKLFNCTSGGPYEIPIRINKPSMIKKTGIKISNLLRRKNGKYFKN